VNQQVKEPDSHLLNMAMFDPAEKKKEKALKNKKKKTLSDIKNWGLSLIPAGDLHAGNTETLVV